MLIPLLSTLLGGLLTIIGGFLGSYYTQLSLNKSVKRNEARSMIEELYLILQSNDNLMSSYKSLIDKKNIDEMRKKIDDLETKLDRAKMINDLYLHQVANDDRMQKYFANCSEYLHKLQSALDNNENDKLSQLTYQGGGYVEPLKEALKKAGYSVF